MNITRKIVLTGVVTLAAFALGSAGAAAVAHTLTIEDRTGAAQKSSPVTTGTTVPSSSAVPFNDKSVDPTGTTTVSPVDPMYVDEHGDVRHNRADDGVAPGVGDHRATDDSTDDSTGDSTRHDGGGDRGVLDAPSPSPSPSPSTSGSQGSISTSDGPDMSGSSSGSGDGGGSHDSGGQR